MEYQRRYAGKIKQTTVVTEIGRKVYDTLDYALKSKRMVIIEGNAHQVCNASATAFQPTGNRHANTGFHAASRSPEHPEGRQIC